jgi:hypothetical protein
MTEEAGLSAADRWFAINLRKAREDSDVSQRWVADRMRKAGFRFFPQTVGRIEGAEQPARLGEARALAAIFGMSAEAMSEPPAVNREAWVLIGATGRIATTRAEAHDAARRYAEARERLADLVERARAGEHADRLAGEITKAERALKET